MKTIGLIGGMSWESSSEYYRIINHTVKEKLGNSHSAKSLMLSVDFEEIKRLMLEDDWDKLKNIMVNAAIQLEKGGADFIVICTNTMHRLVEDIAEKTNLPVLHIADATALKVKEKNIRKVGLLGTKFTMEQDFYKKHLAEKHNLEVIVPNEEDRNTIHDIIFNELCLSQIKKSSKREYIRIINDLKGNGVEGVILGCTEIPLLIKQEDVSIPIFDTTRIHAETAVEFALE